MADSRVGDIAAMKLSVADGRLLAQFAQFKNENFKMADSRVDIAVDSRRLLVFYPLLLLFSHFYTI